MEQNTTPDNKTNTFSERANNVFNALKESGVFSEDHRNLFMEKVSTPENAEKAFNALKESGVFTEDHRNLFIGKLYPTPKGVPYADTPERSSMTDQFKVFGQAAEADEENRRKAAEHIAGLRKAHEEEQNTKPRLMTPEEVNEMARQPLSLGKSLDLFGQQEKTARQTEEMFRKRDEPQTAEYNRQIIEKNMAALDGLKKRLSEVENDLKGKNKDGTLHNEEMRSILEDNIKRLTEDTRKKQSAYFDKKISELNDLYGAAHLKKGYNLINSTEERRKHLQGISDGMAENMAEDIVRNRSLITDALKNMQRSKRKALLDNDAGTWSKFWSGMATGFDGGAGLTLGLSDLSEALHAKAALRRMQEGKGTTTDRILVNSLLDKIDAKELYEPGIAGQIGQGVYDSLEFMLDMAITGGVGGAVIKGVKTAGKAIAKAAGKSIAMETAETAAKSATKQFAKQIGKDIAASAVGSLASPMMYNEAVRRQNENYLFGRDENGEVTVREAADPESLSESFAQAFLSNNISRIVERGVGPVLEKGMQAIAKPLVKITPEWLRFGNNFISNLGRNVKDWMSVQGFLPESVEEFVEELLTRSIVDQTAREKELGAGKWDDLFSPEWCTVTLGAVAVIQAAMGLPGFSASTSNTTANASRMRKYMKRLPDNIRLDVRRISAMEDDNQRAQALSSLLKRSTDLQRRDIMGYLSSRAANNLGVSFSRAEAQQQEAENYRQTLLAAAMDGQNLYIASDRSGNLFAFKPTDNQDPWSIGFPLDGSVENGTLKIGKPRQIDTDSLDMDSVQEYSMEDLLGALAQRQEQQNEEQDTAIGQQEQQAAMPDADAEKVYVAGHEFNYTDPKGNIKTVARGSRIVPIETVPSDADPNTVVQVAITKPGSATSSPGVIPLSEFQNMLEQGYITAEEQTDTDTASDVQTDEDGNPLPEDEAPIQQEAKPEVESGTEPQEVLPPAQQTPTIENNKDAVAETGTEAAGDTAAESTDNEALKANGSGTGADIETQGVENNEVEPAQPRTNTGEVEPEVSVGTNTEGLMSVVSEVVRNDLIGRSATEEEAADLIARMEANAEAAPEVELTPENWTAQFGENGEVETPIGTVKMGENQYFKLAKRGRDGKLGMVKPTLENPDVIVEDERLPKNGSVSERDTSYVFIKSFTAADGHRYYYFTSVTVKKGNNEVVISNQEKDKKRISELLQQGNVTRISPETSLHPKPQVGKSVSLNETNTPTESDNQDALLGINSSEAPGTDKGTQVAEEKQIRLPENPVQTKYESLLAKTGDENNVIQLANQMVANMQAELNKAQKSKPTGKNEEELLSSILANKEKVSALEKEVQFWKDVAAFPERKRQSEEAARKQQKKIDAQQRAEQARKKNPQRLRLMDRDDALGEPLSLEEYVLRRIATGATKFLWNGTSQGTGGLREHGGGKRFMLQYVDKNTGKVPEVVADDMAQDIMDNYPEFGNVTASDILDSIEGIGVGEQSFSDLMTRAEELHNSNDYDAQAREEAEEFDREERANEEAAAELARQSVESISDEEYIEISRPRFVGEMFNGDGTPKTNTSAKKVDGNDPQVQKIPKGQRISAADTSPLATDRQAKTIARQLKKLGLKGEVFIVDDVAELVKEARARLQRVFHGSPHGFEAFDFSHMDTGEGAQAYGWGGYVTEVKGIGQSYAESLAGRNYTIEINKLARHIDSKKDFIKTRQRDIKEMGDYDRYAKRITKNRRDSEKEYKKAEKAGNKSDMDFYKDLIAISDSQLKRENHKALIDSFWDDINNAQEDIAHSTAEIAELKEKHKKEVRHLYHVEIPTEQDGNYLRWDDDVDDATRDKILSGVTQIADASVDADYFAEKLEQYGDKYNIDGEALYKLLSEYAFRSDKAASEFLSSLGFVGISYPAQYQSGGRADGKRNYVIFKESDMKITDHIRYEQDASGEIAGATLPNGDVLLNRQAMRIDTPFHEFAHKLFTYAKGNRSAGRLYEAIRHYAQEAPQAVKDYVSARYPDLKDDAYLDEVFAWALSRQSEGGLEAFLKERGIGVDDTASRTWYERVWDTLKSLWAEVRPKVSRLLGRDFADLSVFDAYDEMGAEETGKALYDLMMSGKRLPGAEKSAEGADARAQMEGAEEAEIERRAKADGTWLKAPNGKLTKLTPKQWVQVRTKAFKDWFGDWEKAARIEKLRDSKPIAITGNEIEPSEDLKQYKKNALDYGKTLRGEYTNKDTGNKVNVSATSLKEVLRHDGGDIAHIQSVAAIPAIIENGIYIDTVTNEDTEKNPNVREYQYYVTGLKIGGVDYTVKSVVAIDRDRNRYYDHALTQIEKGNLLNEVDRITSPSRQEANSLSGIKDKRLLSILQTNASKVVDENGEPLVVYHGTPNKFTIFDASHISETSGDRGLFGAGFYFNPDAGYVKLFAGHNGYIVPAFLNIKRPYVVEEHDIDELSKFLGDVPETEVEMFRVFSPTTQIKVLSAKREDSFTENLKKAGYDGVLTRDYDPAQLVAFSPTQIKSATDNVGTFDAGNADIRYQRNWYGGNSGYVGYSMSRRAAEARGDGRFPKTDFKKEYGITDKSLGALTKLGLIDDSVWHHTSKYGNKTTFYGWQDEASYDTYKRNKKGIDRLSRDYAAATDKALGGERPPFLSEFDLSRPDMGRIGNDMLTYLQYSVHKKSALTEEEKASFRSRHDQVSQSGLPVEDRRAKHREIEAEETELSNAREAEIRKELRDTEEYRAAMKDVEVRIEAYNQAQSVLGEIENVMQRAEPNAIRYRFAGDMFDADGTPKRYRFIGEKGAANLDKAEEANTRLDNLAMARDMEAAGKDAKTVKMATGWERGADKKWRYEEADFEINQDFSDKIEFQKKHNKASIFKGEYPTIALGSLIKDESLFKAYPELKDLSIQFQDMSREVLGFYTPKTYIFPASITLRDDLLRRVDNPEFYEELNRIYAKDPIFKAQMRAIFSDNKEEIQKYDEAVKKSPFWKEYDDLVNENSGIKSTKFMFQEKSILAHELQHAIQDIEGFDRGGNDKTYRKHLDSLKEKHDAWSMIKEFDSKRDELGQDALPIDVYNAVRDEYLSLGFKFGVDGFASRDAFDKGFNLWARGYDKEGYEDAYNEYQSLTGKFGLGLSNDRYRELSGEVEARNVQNRMDMTPEERRASLASETEDVARKDQIFLKDALGVPAESTDEAFKGNQAETNLSSNSQSAKRKVAEELSKRLGVPVAVEDRTTPKGRSRRFAGAKAWFVLPNARNPKGEVHINIENHADAEDVERSILHEVVGHMGMRRMMGEAGYNALLDKVYGSMDEGARTYFGEYARQEFARKDGMTDEQYQAELRRVAADEYIAALAEVGADPTTWQKVVALVREALRRIGFSLSLSDADIHALLYESRHNLESAAYYAEREILRQRQEEFRTAAELSNRIEEDEWTNARMRRDLSGTEYDKRLGVVSLTPYGATKRQELHNLATLWGKRLLDSSLPLKNLTNNLNHTKGGKVTSDTDLWSLKTTIPAKVMHGIDRFKKTIGNPLSDTIRTIYKKTREQQKELGVPAKKKSGTYYIGMYLMAKHMPERNAWMLADRMLGNAIEDISQRIFNMTGGRGAMSDKDMNELRRAVLTRFGSGYNNALSESSIQEITRQIHGIIEKRNQERFEKEKSRAEKKGITPPVDTMQPLTVEDMGMVAEKAYAALNDRLGKLTDEDRDFSGATDFMERFGLKPEEYVDRFEAIMRENGLESELDKMWDYINQATEFSLRERLESGLLSNEAYNNIMARGWKNYVPLRSWDERNEESADFFEIEYPERIDNNSTVFTNPTIKAKGRKSLADNPLPYIFRDAETAIRKGEDNRFFQAAARLRDNNANLTYIFGNADFLNGKETSKEKISRLVPYYNNGTKTNVVFVNPQLAAAVRGDTESAFGKVWRSAALNWIPPVTRFMSAMLTSMNPAFATLNLIRDLGLATFSRFVESSDPFSGVLNAGLFLYEWFKNMPAAIQASARPESVHTSNARNARLIRAWKENGGETGWHTLNDLRKTKDILYKEITKSGARKGIENVAASIPAMFRFFTEVSENSVRLAAFSDAKRRGLDDQAAAFYSKEVTTNFNRHSNLSSAVNPLFMFFNAATQGINRILKLMKENPGNFGITAVGMMATGFVSAITNAAGGDDEDDYLHRSFYVQSNNLVIGKWTIPLAHGFRMFYGIGAAYADYVMGNASETEMFYNVLGLFGNELLPGPLNLTDLATYNTVEDRINWISEEGIGNYMRNLVPSSILPVYEIYRNRNFMGGTISKEPFPGTESKYTPRVARSKKNVNPWLEALNYKWAGLQGFDPELDSEIAWDDKENRPTGYYAISASDIEHLISQYAGGTGEFVNDMVKLGTKIARGEEFTKTNVPVLKKLYRPTDPENAIMGDYYTIKEYADVLQMKIDEAWNQVQNDPDLSDRGRRKAVDRILNLSLAQAESQLKAFGKYQEIVEELYKMQRKGVSENELKPYRIWLMKEANNIKEGMLLELEPEQGERYARIMDIKNGDLRGLAAFWKFIEDTYGGKAVNE